MSRDSRQAIVGVLLAAGQARRFGSSKVLHLLPDGKSLAAHSAANLAEAVDRTLAVVAPGDNELSDLLASMNIEVHACARSHEGMGASLACGVRASAEAGGWIIALADMPFLRPATIRAVATALRAGAPIAAPVHGDERGHPVGFSRAYYAELVALGGDVGAKNILARDRSRIVLLPVDDPGIHRDIDTPGDLDGQ